MRTRIALTGLLVGAIAFTGAVVPAASDATGTGNCVAVLTSFYGPQRQVDDAAHLLRSLAAQSGMTFGEVARALTRQSGDVNSCLAYLGLG